MTFSVTVLPIGPRLGLGEGDASKVRALRLRGPVLGGLELGGLVLGPPDPPEIFFTGLLRGLVFLSLSLESDELE